MKQSATYRVLMALSLVVTFISCQREPLGESGDAIRFSVTQAVTSDLQTKAAPSAEADLNKFTVWGSMKEGASDWKQVFKNQPQEVTYKQEGSTISWDYGTTQYWNRNANYRFCAVFPTTADVQNGSGSDNVIVSYPSLPGYDLMVASSPLIDAAGNGSEPVKLEFRHACAAVRFLFAKESNDARTYSITGLVLQNISASGTMTYVGASNDSGASISWSAPSKTDFTWTGGPWSVPAATTSVPFALITTPEWLFAVPQSLAGTPAPTIKISYTVDGRALEVTLDLKTDSISKWDNGNAYTYNVKVSPKVIGVTVTITPWEIIDAQTPGLMI